VRKDSKDFPGVLEREVEETDGELRSIEHGECKVANSFPVGFSNPILF
jgi:hypothetical protein